MSEPFVEDIDKIRELTIQLAKNCQFRIECGFLVIGHPFAQQNPVMVNVAGKIKHFNIADDKGKTVVIVTHATPIRALLCRLKGMTLDQMKDVSWVSNASVTVVRVEDDNWILEQTGEDAHLSGLRTQFPANV